MTALDVNARIAMLALLDITNFCEPASVQLISLPDVMYAHHGRHLA